MLDVESMVRAWPFEHFSKWSRVPSAGFQPSLRSVVATSEPSSHCLFYFLLGWLEAPSLASSSRFTLPLERSKITLTASLPEAWLVAMSRSSLVVHGPLCPSL